jgi:hypothetical protein
MDDFFFEACKSIDILNECLINGFDMNTKK